MDFAFPSPLDFHYVTRKNCFVAVYGRSGESLSGRVPKFPSCGLKTSLGA